MVANEFLNQYKSLQAFNYVGVEDFPDRLSFFHSVTILMVCCSIVTVRTYFFHPLSCYVPSAFGSSGGAQELFVNNFCWTEGTFAVHPRQFVLNARLPDSGLSKYKQKKLTYYQWVPLVLGIQCIFFYLPRLLWTFIAYEKSGTDVSHIIKTVYEAAESNDEKHDTLMQHACKRLELLLRRSHANAGSRLHSIVSHGNWLILFYFCVKSAYLANALLQLLLMQRFLGQADHLFGLQLLTDLVNGTDWRESLTFPRVVSCAVYVKSGSHGHWQASQCALPVNMINEKIFVFLWFWIIIVAIATATSMVIWALRIFSGSSSADFIRRCARASDAVADLHGNPWLTKFELEFLRNDGAFLLKMVAINCGDIACSDLLLRLWNRFLHQRKDSKEVSVNGLLIIATGGTMEQAGVNFCDQQK